MGEAPPGSAADRMAERAAAWLSSLDSQQRRLGLFAAPGEPASDQERTRFFYTPTDHGGLALGAQTPAQAAESLLELALKANPDPGFYGELVLSGKIVPWKP